MYTRGTVEQIAQLLRELNIAGRPVFDAVYTGGDDRQMYIGMEGDLLPYVPSDPSGACMAHGTLLFPITRHTDHQVNAISPVTHVIDEVMPFTDADWEKVLAWASERRVPGLSRIHLTGIHTPLHGQWMTSVEKMNEE